MKRISFYGVGAGVFLGLAWITGGRFGYGPELNAPRREEASAEDRSGARQRVEFEARRSSAGAGPVRSGLWQVIAPEEPPAGNGAGDMAGRMEALRQLDGPLSAAEVEQGCWFLEAVPVIAGMDEAAAAELKNELMNRLGSQPEAMPRFSQALLRMCGDSRQREVMRDYALQHLGAWYDSIDDGARPAVLERFWSAAEHGAGSVGGTALLNLERLMAAGEPVPGGRARLAALAGRLLSDDAAPEPARMAALQILRTSEPQRALEAARQIAREGAAPALLTVALGVLGQCGAAADAEWLRQSPLCRDGRYRPVIETALAAFSQSSHENR